MKAASEGNLDFLTARLHGRRSRLADGSRLEELCRRSSVQELKREILPEAAGDSVAEVQRRLVQDLAREIADYATHLNPAGAGLLQWLMVRFQVENLKILVRGFTAGRSWAVVRDHLILLPREFTFEERNLASAASVRDLVAALPDGWLRRNLAQAVAIHHDSSQPFFIEAMLDHNYLDELLAKSRALGKEDKELVLSLVCQEADTFHLMLAARGRLFHGLSPQALLPLHVAGTLISRSRFDRMLAAQDLQNAARLTVGRALDALPPPASVSGEGTAILDPATVEVLARNRFLRLANRAFRRSHLGLASVVAFVEMRRMEVANLITVSEGLRTHISLEGIRSHLILPNREATHV